MALQRCTHCGLEGDPKIAAMPHKSTCRTAGKDSDYILVGKTKPMTTKATPIEIVPTPAITPQKKSNTKKPTKRSK